MWLRVLAVGVLVMAVTGATPQPAAPYDATLLQALTWRQLGSDAPEVATAHVTHVSADTAFPYRVCGSQPDRGTVCVSSRQDPDPATTTVWHLGGTAATGPSAPDPLSAHVVYTGGVLRADRRTGQVQDVSPTGVADTPAPAPLLFAPRDPRTLYFATDVLWTTTTGGRQWTFTQPPSGGRITTLAPSPVDGRFLWLGSEDRRVTLLRDGGTLWTDVTPNGLSSTATITRLEASHFDTNTAYLVVQDTDAAPHIHRTRDAGRTWQRIVHGLPDSTAIHTVREDPFRRGLLFATGDRHVSVSFDDGDLWQSLQLNMPAVPVRDLVIKDADLVVGTAGLGLWILDDITPLRQITTSIAKVPAYLFRPPPAWRVRGQAAPSGASLSYALGADADGPVILEIVEVDGPVIRQFTDLPTTPGLHRLQWDLRQTTGDGHSLWVMPGTYQVRLTVGGVVTRQAVTVRMDPRVDTSVADLALQHKLSKSVYDIMRRLDTRRANASAAQFVELERQYAPLPALLRALQAADARPTTAQEAAVAAALAGAATK